MTKHRLELEIEAERKEALTAIAKKILGDVRDAIDNRNKWIQAREKQKAQLETIRENVIKAYDSGDEEALESEKNILSGYNIGNKTNSSTGYAKEAREYKAYDNEEYE